MIKCENCIHNPVCDHNKYGYENCGNFKDKSLFVELPCKVGQEAYIINYCDKQVEEHKIISIEIDNIKWLILDFDSPFIHKFPVEQIGELVFLDRAEAERRLSEVGE